MEKKEFLLHFHGASTGEIQCALRLLSALDKKDFLANKYVLITYTSKYAADWLNRRKYPFAFKSFLYKKRSLRNYLNEIELKNSEIRMLLVVMEKDRRRWLMQYYRDRGKIINVEAKPPQSLKSIVYERLIGRSMGKVNYFICENEEFKKNIDKYKPGSEIDVTGTLKAVIDSSSTKELNSVNSIAYISVHPREVYAVAKVINNMKDHNPPLQHIIIPRYTKSSWMPFKDIRRFKKKISKWLGRVNVAHKLDKLFKFMERQESGIIMYLNTTNVIEILRKCHFAIVCGTLTDGVLFKGKGHNYFEPLSCNIPTIIGFKNRSWLPTVKELMKHGLVYQEKPSEIHLKIKELLDRPSDYKKKSLEIYNAMLLRYQRESDERIGDRVMAFYDSWCDG